nr:synaptobrevin, longin-like domain protein [Tanacetum cinerariifolium]
MVAILEKTEHNTDFHQIVGFLEASHIRYALTISHTVYVSHIRQFWSTARIETKILATVDGYNILPNQRFTFQKGQFSHQWKFLNHTIMQCLSPKSTGFNEFSSNISTAVVCLATNRVYNFSKMIFDGMVRNINSKGTKFLMHPRVKAQQTQHDSSPPSHQPIISKPIPQTPTETSTLRRYTRRAIRIAQSKALSPAADEHASLSRDDRQGEAFPTGSMQQRIHELMELYTSLQRQQSHMATKIKDQDLEISGLKERVKSLEDKERRSAEPTQEDAPITRGIKEIWEELGADKNTELESNDTEEMVNMLTSMEAVNILTSGGAAASISPGDVFPTVGVPTSMRSPIIGAKDKGKEKVVKSEVPKKRKLQEQIDAQVPREMKEEFARENQRVSEQLARHFEIARLYDEEELKMMIEGPDRNNEVIEKHLREYEQAAVDLSVGEKLDLISELVKYQDHRVKILKYQAQQSKPLSKKEKREFYMSVLRSHARWKTKHFRGMTLEKIKEKFIPVWKELEDFVPMEDLHQLWTLVKETFSIKQATKDKEKELSVELKRLFEPNFEDQLWTHNQAFMHDPLDWKLYDTCGVHHVSTKVQEIFMLVEKDYPLRKGLATMMIILDEELIEASSPDEHLILKT